MKAWGIVYTSNTGYTKRYAEILGQKLDLRVYSSEEAKKTLEPGAPVIYLGWLMAGKVKGYKKANRQYEVLAVCGVGLSENSQFQNKMRKENGIPEEIPVFLLQGGMDHAKLKGIHKFAIKMLIKMIGSKKGATEDENKMLELLQKGGDFVSEDNLAEVIKWYNDRLES